MLNVDPASRFFMGFGAYGGICDTLVHWLADGDVRVPGADADVRAPVSVGAG